MLVSSHSLYESIWVRMLSSLYLSSNINVDLIYSNFTSDFQPCQELGLPFDHSIPPIAFPKISKGTGFLFSFKCPFCLLDLKGNELFLHKYSKTHLESHYIKSRPKSIQGFQKVTTKRCTLLVDQLSEAIYSAKISSSFIGSFSKLNSYIQGLVLDSRFSYFDIERTVYQMEKICQIFFTFSIFSYISRFSALLKDFYYVIISSSKLRLQEKTNLENLDTNSINSKLHKNRDILKNSPTKTINNPTIENYPIKVRKIKRLLEGEPTELDSRILITNPKANDELKCKYEMYYPEQNIHIACRYNRFPILSWMCSICGFLNVITSEISLKSIREPYCCFSCNKNIWKQYNTV